ncbi:MAG: type IV pilus secretin PilQ [bacterium]
MAQNESHNLLRIVCMITSISFCLLACAPARVPVDTTSMPSSERILITDIGREMDEQTTTLIIYSTQTVNYTSFAQQDPPSIVIEMPDTYVHSNLRPLEFTEGPVTKVIPEQVVSDDSVKARLTLEMRRGFPYEIQRETNQLRIGIKSYTTLTPPVQTAKAAAKEEGITEKESAKDTTVRKLAMPERTILRTIPDEKGAAPGEPIEYVPTAEPEKKEATPAAIPPSREKALPSRTAADTGERDLLLGKRVYSGKPISLDFQNADIRSVLRIIADVSGHNLVIDPEVKGKVDITLVKPVPWDQALDVILKTNKLSMKMEGNIIRVGLPQTFTAEKEAELSAIQAARKAKEEANKVIPLSTKIVSINYASAEVLMSKLQPMLSKSEGLAEPPSIMVDERTNTLIIKDLPEVIDEIQGVIATLDRPTPQVMIEARIVETNKNFAKDLGIQWGGTYSKQTSYRFANSIEVRGTTGTDTGLGGLGPTGRSDQYMVNLPISSAAFGAIGINLGHVNGATALDMQLKAMETSGKGRIVSNPRIATLDNEQATIKSGHSIPYQTTDSEGNPSTQFVDAAINLTVTPQITPDDNITMQIQADKSEPDWSRTVAGAPSIITRTATTKLIVSDGDTAVIGGLAQANEQSNQRKVPLFGDLPLIGVLFRTEDKTDGFDELLIFITPRIIRETPLSQAMIE